MDIAIDSYPLDSDVSHISIFHMVESLFLFTLNSLLCHHVMLFFIDCPLSSYCLLWILALLKQRIKNDITTKYVRACTATEMIPTIEMIPNYHRNDPHHRNDTGGHHRNDPRNIGNGIKGTRKTGQQFSACFLFIYIASFLRCVIYLLPHFILQ